MHNPTGSRTCGSQTGQGDTTHIPQRPFPFCTQLWLQAPNSTDYHTTIPLPNLPKPSPSPPPAPPKPVRRFAPVAISSATIAVIDADAACPLVGSALATGLPAKLYNNGVASETLLPSTVAYTDGLAVIANNTDWSATPSGCSLRIDTIKKADGYNPIGYAGIVELCMAESVCDAAWLNAMPIGLL